MNQGRILLRSASAGLVACLLLAGGECWAQAARPRRPAQSSDEPNITGEQDAAAGDLVDSLFAPFAPVDPLTAVATGAVGGPAPRSRRPTWSARLARNPHPEDGQPPFVLIDRYGGIQRYVEPTSGVDLERFVGETIAVRRDTGGTLLASQLDLPRSRPLRDAAPLAAEPAGGVRLASQLEPTPADDAPAATDALPAPEATGESIDGQIVDEGPIMYDGGYEGSYDGMVVPDGVDPLYLDGQSEFGTCDVCAGDVCGGRGCYDPCGFGSRPIFYARAEYLLWEFDGMYVPPLVVNADLGGGNPPALLNPRVVFGDQEVLDDARSGARFTLGYFLDDYGKWAIEGDYVVFDDESLRFQDGGNGLPPYVGRPYIDATTGMPAVEDVVFVDINGTVTVDIESSFSSAGVRFRRNLCCVAGCTTGCGSGVTCGSPVGGCDSCGGANPSCPMCPVAASALGRWFGGGTRHVDVLYGVRWTQLDESLRVHEDLVADDETTFLIDDVFETDNEFFGGEIGFLVDWQKRRWSLEMLSKLAIGSTNQRVRISGQTIRDGQTFPNIGLLAQPSNVGVYERDEFSVIPEIGVTAGYQITERLRLTAGYTLLYWSQVVRPGDQIDLRVNPQWLNLPTDPEDLPDPNTIQPQSPEFVFRQTDIWAHGLSAGIDYRW
jgi:hypothetical protein